MGIANMKHQGFSEDSARFLAELAMNNERAWFEANKARYRQHIEEPAKAFLGAMIPRLEKLAGSTVGGKVFRIHRDVRFSKDKTPYNSHVRLLFHGEMPEGEGCGAKPAFYFSFEADRVLTGTGCMEFPKATLASFRAAVLDAKRGPALLKVLARYEGKVGYRLEEPALKRVPPGFDVAHPRADLLRHKGLVLWHEQPAEQLTSAPDAVDAITKLYKEMQPIYDWLDAI